MKFVALFFFNGSICPFFFFFTTIPLLDFVLCFIYQRNKIKNNNVNGQWPFSKTKDMSQPKWQNKSYNKPKGRHLWKSRTAQAQSRVGLSLHCSDSGEMKSFYLYYGHRSAKHFFFAAFYIVYVFIFFFRFLIFFTLKMVQYSNMIHTFLDYSTMKATKVDKCTFVKHTYFSPWVNKYTWTVPTSPKY